MDHKKIILRKVQQYVQTAKKDLFYISLKKVAFGHKPAQKWKFQENVFQKMCVSQKLKILRKQFSKEKLRLFN